MKIRLVQVVDARSVRHPLRSVVPTRRGRIAQISPKTCAKFRHDWAGQHGQSSRGSKLQRDVCLVAIGGLAKPARRAAKFHENTCSSSRRKSCDVVRLECFCNKSCELLVKLALLVRLIIFSRRSNAVIFGRYLRCQVAQPALPVVYQLALDCLLKISEREVGLLGLRTTQREIKSDRIQ